MESRLPLDISRKYGKTGSRNDLGGREMRKGKIKKWIFIIACVLTLHTIMGCSRQEVAEPEPKEKQEEQEKQEKEELKGQEEEQEAPAEQEELEEPKVSVEPEEKEVLSSPEEAVLLWNDFLSTKQYLEYTSEYEESSLEYTITDLNADQIPELLIQSSEADSFYNTWTFLLQGQKIVLIDETYGFGSYRYSTKYNAVLQSPEFKPFNGTGYTSFFQIQNGEWKYIFEVGQDDGKNYYIDDGGEREITDEERDSFFTEVIFFDWRMINEGETW